MKSCLMYLALGYVSEGWEPKCGILQKPVPQSACPRNWRIWLLIGKKQAKEFLTKSIQVRILRLWTCLFPVPQTLSSAALLLRMSFSSESHRQLLGSRDTSHPMCMFAEVGK